MTLRVPPLRERRADIPALAHHILAQLVEEIPWAHGASFTAEAVAALVEHDWPGNIRELRNTIAQSLFAREGAAIRPADLRFARDGAAGGAATGASPLLSLQEAEAQHIREAVSRHRGNLVHTARALRIDRSTLRRKMRQLGIVGGDERGAGG